MFVRNAMLFAAGLGTRLLPLTAHTPKPLVHVGGKPLLDYTLERFLAYGTERVVVNTHHLAAQVAAHVGTLGGAARARIQLSHEPVLLETGGGILQALGWLGTEPFFSANSDAFWLDGRVPALERLALAFDPARMDALLLLVDPARAIGFSGPGDFDLTDTGQITRARRRLVYSGLQLLHPRLFDGYLPAAGEPRAFSLKEIWARAQQPDGSLPRLYGLVHDDHWVHVGTPQ
ncbi:MAG TPA: nucleotidyltransferase family protein, partial [Polyangiales bacterium]